MENRKAILPLFLLNRLGRDGLIKKAWQLPTFPLKSSIIGVRELDFRVRDGNGYCLSTMATRHYY